MTKASQNYLDLLLFGLLTLLLWLVFFFPPWLSGLRVAMVFIFVLLAPGYALAAILFPKQGDIDLVERIVISVGLSVASMSLVALILNYTLWGISVVPMTVGLSALTLLALGGASLRRRFTSQTQRFMSSETLPAFRGNLQGLLGLVLVVAALMTTVELLRPSETSTEFYVLGSEGRLEAYPLDLRPGQTFSVTLGVTNYEGNSVAFTIRIPLGDEEKVVEVPGLENGQSWEQSVELSVPSGLGQAPLTFHLYKEGDEEPYRSVQLFVSSSNLPQRPFTFQVV